MESEELGPDMPMSWCECFRSFRVLKARIGCPKLCFGPWVCRPASVEVLQAEGAVVEAIHMVGPVGLLSQL